MGSHEQNKTELINNYNNLSRYEVIDRIVALEDNLNLNLIYLLLIPLML